MTKGERYEVYKAKRQRIKKDIEAAIKKKTDTSKFQELIKLTKEYETVTMAMNLDGWPVKVWPEKMTSKKWIDAYEEYLNETNNKTQTKTKAVKTDKQRFTISLCWTVKPEYCVCDSVIDILRNYFSSIGLKSDEILKNEFPDRIEFCKVYKVTCTQEKFKLILKSAEYILSISTNSAYDNCNIGVIGKELK